MPDEHPERQVHGAHAARPAARDGVPGGGVPGGGVPGGGVPGGGVAGGGVAGGGVAGGGVAGGGAVPEAAGVADGAVADRLHAAREHAQHRLTRHRRSRALRGTVSVALVMALSGALFTANARLASGTNARQPQDLAGLQANEDARRERLAADVAALREKVDALTREETDTVGLEWQSAGTAYDIASGRLAVSGTGITVSLDDAPADGPRPAGTGPDDLVVHQQDLQAVINALWAGGAEAMALMDQRVISTSAFQCIGNVLSLQGRRYSPPYVVTAVGDPEELLDALDADPAVRAYRSWVDAVGLGWSVTRPDGGVQVPAYDGSVDMRYASVPSGTEVLPGLVAGGAATSPDEGQEDTEG